MTTPYFPAQAMSITGPCSCSEEYLRLLPRRDPSCAWHGWGEEIAAALRSAYRSGWEAGRDAAADTAATCDSEDTNNYLVDETAQFAVVEFREEAEKAIRALVPEDAGACGPHIVYCPACRPGGAK